MKSFKPLASGVTVLIVAALLMSIPLFVALLRYPSKDGYYFVLHWHVWTVLCVSVLVFSVGFVWQYLKAR